MGRCPILTNSVRRSTAPTAPLWCAVIHCRLASGKWDHLRLTPKAGRKIFPACLSFWRFDSISVDKRRLQAPYWYCLRVHTGMATDEVTPNEITLELLLFEFSQRAGCAGRKNSMCDYQVDLA